MGTPMLDIAKFYGDFIIAGLECPMLGDSNYGYPNLFFILFHSDKAYNP
jgi:hypothetical protein